MSRFLPTPSLSTRTWFTTSIRVGSSCCTVAGMRQEVSIHGCGRLISRVRVQFKMAICCCQLVCETIFLTNTLMNSRHPCLSAGMTSRWRGEWLCCWICTPSSRSWGRSTHSTLPPSPVSPPPSWTATMTGREILKFYLKVMVAIHKSQVYSCGSVPSETTHCSGRWGRTGTNFTD